MPNILTFTTDTFKREFWRIFPGWEFIAADGCIGCRLHCLYVKMINLDALRRALMEGVFPVEVDSDDAPEARRALGRMMAVPRDV